MSSTISKDRVTSNGVKKLLSSSSSSTDREEHDRDVTHVIRHSSSSHLNKSKISRSMSMVSVLTHNSALAAGGKLERIPGVTFGTSEKIMVILLAIMSGLIHLIWYNTVLQLGPYIDAMIPGYAPCPIWLPLGSVGSMIGMLTYYFIPAPIKFIQVIVPCIIIIVGSVLWPLFLGMTKNGTMSEGACTGIISVLIIVMEIARGLISSQNYGVSSFFRPYGKFSESLSIALSAGEGISGIIPWLIFFCHGLSEPVAGYDADDYLYAIITASAVNMVAFALYLALFLYVFKVQKSSKIVFETTTERNNTMRKLAKDTGSESVFKAFLRSFKGTKTVGMTLFVCFASTLNVYPNVAPLGFNWVEMEDATILLGLFTCLDPIFRCFGFILPKMMNGKVIPKMLYGALVLVKLIAFLPSTLIPYYAGDNPPSWMSTMAQETALVVMIAVAQGSCVVLGIYCYFCHLPSDSKYIELSSSLVTLYIIGGVTAGQILFLIYPAFKN